MPTSESQKFLKVASLLGVGFLLLPLVFVLAKGLQWEALRSLFAREDILSAASQSLGLAMGSALLTTFLGTMTALAMPQLGPRFESFVRGALVFPMVLPEIAIGLSLLVWFVHLGFPLGWGTLLGGHIALCLGYSTFVMKARVESLDESLLDAARDLGANRWGVFRHGLFPQLLPALLASFLMCFALSLDDFLISVFVKGFDQMLLPIQIFSMMRVRLGPEIYALASLLFCISLLGVLLTQIGLLSRSSKKIGN